MRPTILFVCLFAILFGTSPGWSQTSPQISLPLETRVNTLETTVASLRASVASLEDTAASLQASVTAFQSLTRYIQVVENAATSTYHGLKGPHVIFTGANVHIRSGSGVTDRVWRPAGQQDWNSIPVGLGQSDYWLQRSAHRRYGQAEWLA